MENYASAAARHWDSVVLLTHTECWQEAAYLAGYVAECSFKALLQTSSLPSTQRLGHSLMVLSGEALQLALVLEPAAARYRVQTLRPGGMGISGWQPEQRYEATDLAREPEFRQMVQEADVIAHTILIGMVLDGLLSEVPQ